MILFSLLFGGVKNLGRSWLDNPPLLYVASAVGWLGLEKPLPGCPLHSHIWLLGAALSLSLSPSVTSHFPEPLLGCDFGSSQYTWQPQSLYTGTSIWCFRVLRASFLRDKEEALRPLYPNLSWEVHHVTYPILSWPNKSQSPPRFEGWEHNTLHRRWIREFLATFNLPRDSQRRHENKHSL